MSLDPKVEQLILANDGEVLDAIRCAAHFADASHYIRVSGLATSSIAPSLRALVAAFIASGWRLPSVAENQDIVFRLLDSHRVGPPKMRPLCLVNAEWVEPILALNGSVDIWQSAERAEIAVLTHGQPWLIHVSSTWDASTTERRHGFETLGWRVIGVSVGELACPSDVCGEIQSAVWTKENLDSIEETRAAQRAPMQAVTTKGRLEVLQ